MSGENLIEAVKDGALGGGATLIDEQIIDIAASLNAIRYALIKFLDQRDSSDDTVNLAQFLKIANYFSQVR